MNKPVRTWWHELNTWEPGTALEFYRRTLGWEFSDSELPDGSSYWIATKEGAPVGGVFGLSDPIYDGIPSHWMTYMAVRDIAEAEDETTAAGGEVLRPATHVPGVGTLAVVSDASGALIGLIEPDKDHILAQTLDS